MLKLTCVLPPDGRPITRNPATPTTAAAIPAKTILVCRARPGR